jgi:hypothetical protein
MSDFYTALRKKLEMKPSREFDQNFWAKFNEEFSSSPSSSRSQAFFEKFQISWKIWTTGFASVAALFLLFFFSGTHTGQPFANNTAEIQVMAQQEMLSEMGFFQTFDSLADGLPTSDEDWDILLPQKEAS